MSENHQNSKTQKDSPRNVSNWELGALAAAALILIAPLIYAMRADHQVAPPDEAELHFIGSQKCSRCHQTAFDQWQGSHHDLAMAEATEQSVLGDFDNATFTDPYTGVTSRFFRRGDAFQVETEGPNGALGIFEITHTFGVYPLQQYLVPFSGGRLQCLNIAWNAREDNWYRLPPYEVEGPDDWLHWTKGGQNWNGMCAECHSTRVVKGFDLDSGSYQTSWFEINVGCEACHGPGSKHAAWADRPAMARPAVENYELAVETSHLDAKEQITICAPCHSRRFQLDNNDHAQKELLDTLVPSLLEEGLYYPDGQILEEVYVYGSFTQSKMFQHDVRCNDCHDMHSLKLHRQDNALCLQCHRAEDYDTYEHHFHKREYQGKPSDGHLCVKCHMPGQLYMGIDYRPDHSLRVPRPDLSLTIGTPNSCSAIGCHNDKSIEWVNDHNKKWYGESRKTHYGEVFAAARSGVSTAGDDLRATASDSLLPAIVRATALSLLRNYPDNKTTETFTTALQDDDALIRYTAIRSLENLDQETKLQLIGPKLYDRVLAVRMEAALALSSLPISALRPDDLQQFKAGLAEYKAAMRYNADFAPQRYNLGNLAAAIGESEEAINYYLQSIGIDDQFYPAKVNLAMQYNQLGKNEQSETLLRQVVDDHPDLFEVAYSLGLLLAEQENYSEAATFLGKAADGMPQYSRARYNQALALLKLKRWQDGELALLKTLEVEPDNREYFMTLANLYLNFKQTERARRLAEQILQKEPGQQDAQELLRMLNQKK